MAKQWSKLFSSPPATPGHATSLNISPDTRITRTVLPIFYPIICFHSDFPENHGWFHVKLIPSRCSHCLSGVQLVGPASRTDSWADPTNPILKVLEPTSKPTVLLSEMAHFGLVLEFVMFHGYITLYYIPVYSLHLDSRNI